MKKIIIFVIVTCVLMPLLVGATFQEKMNSATWYDNGVYLFDNGKYLKSVECLEKALTINSQNDKARELMNKVIQMAKNDLNMKNGKKEPVRQGRPAQDLRQPRVRVYTDDYDSSRAKSYMNKVLVKNMKMDMKKNKTRYKHLNKYLTNAKGSKVEKKKIEHKMSIAKAGDYNSEGLEYAKNGNFIKAIEVFEKALELDPYNVESHVNLGLAYAYTDRLYDAIKEYKLVVKLADPKSKHYEIASSMIEKLKGFI